MENNFRWDNFPRTQCGEKSKPFHRHARAISILSCSKRSVKVRIIELFVTKYLHTANVACVYVTINGLGTNHKLRQPNLKVKNKKWNFSPQGYPRDFWMYLARIFTAHLFRYSKSKFFTKLAKHKTHSRCTQ